MNFRIVFTVLFPTCFGLSLTIFRETTLMWHGILVFVLHLFRTSGQSDIKFSSHYLRIVPSREWWNYRRDWRNCLCSVLMSVRDGQRLGVSGSVSVRAKCLVSHIHSEVCRLSYPLWSLAGRHVERSVTALFSSRSVLITDIQLFHDFTVFLDVKPCGLVYSFKNVFEKNVAGSWIHRYTEGCESRSYHSLVSLLADSCLIVDAGGSCLLLCQL